MKTFSPEQRDAFRLLMRGYSYERIGGELGISKNAVKQRLYNLRKKLGVASCRRMLMQYSHCELFQIGLRELGVTRICPKPEKPGAAVG